MGNFRQKNRFGGKRNSGGFGGRDLGRPQMHSAVCSECGNDCEVPFKPTGDKPIYCSDCFKNKRNNEPRRSGKRDFERTSFGDRRMYSAVCSKCGNDCEVPFKPTGDKPIYCSDCFVHRDKGKGNNQASKQFELINTKLDKILKALGASVTAEVNKKKETIVVKPKKVASAKVKKVTKSKAKKVVKKAKKK